MNEQLIISGVGGQGVLFLTRLLADAAIALDLAVLTSETHGMAQRGGTVISHLKAGGFASPLVRSGNADGMILMKNENLPVHGHFLKPGSWIVADSPTPLSHPNAVVHVVDAAAIADRLGNPQGLNLVLLGFASGRVGQVSSLCNEAVLRSVVQGRLARRPQLIESSIAALEAGLSAAAS